jgi:hypothetical protein
LRRHEYRLHITGTELAFDPGHGIDGNSDLTAPGYDIRKIEDVEVKCRSD